MLDHATCSSFFQARQALSTAEETLMQAQVAGPKLINLARIGKSVVDSIYDSYIMLYTLNSSSNSNRQRAGATVLAMPINHWRLNGSESEW